jgi:hypothetical protein
MRHAPDLSHAPLCISPTWAQIFWAAPGQFTHFDGCCTFMAHCTMSMYYVLAITVRSLVQEVARTFTLYILVLSLLLASSINPLQTL